MYLHAASLPLSDRLGTLVWWSWLVDKPWWVGALLFIAVTPLGLLAVRGLAAGIWVNPITHGWMSANCDFVLGLSFGAMLWLGQRVPDGTRVPAWLSLTLSLLGTVGWQAFGVFHMWDERKAVQSWKRRLGAESVYHFPLFLVIGYPLTYVGVTTLVYAPWNTVSLVAVHLLPLAGMGVWLWAGLVYDPRHQLAPDGQSKHVYTSPEDGWRNVRAAWRWLRRVYAVA